MLILIEPTIGINDIEIDNKIVATNLYELNIIFIQHTMLTITRDVNYYYGAASGQSQNQI